MKKGRTHMDEKLQRAIEVLAERFGDDAVEGIEAVEPYKVVFLADKLAAADAIERSVEHDLAEVVRRSNKPSLKPSRAA
jgi:hypothetical protein